MRKLVLSYRTRQSLCFVESDKKNESINKSINQVKKKTENKRTEQTNKDQTSEFRTVPDSAVNNLAGQPRQTHPRSSGYYYLALCCRESLTSFGIYF